MTTYFTIDDIKQANKASGRHFFSAGAMRFFNSIVYDRPIIGNMFITSERFDMSTPRLYSVSRCNDDGSIDKVSEFQQFTTKAEAEAFMREAAKQAVAV